MKRRHLTIVLLIVLQMNISSNAQDDSIEKFQRIKPMISTKDDVRKLLGEGKIEDDSTWYYFENQTIEIVYSDGTCTENWLTKKDNVVEVSVSFIDRKDLGELKKKVRLDKLRSERSFDVDGEMTSDDLDYLLASFGVHEAGHWFLRGLYGNVGGHSWGFDIMGENTKGIRIGRFNGDQTKTLSKLCEQK